MDEAFPSTSTGGTDSNNDGEKSDTDSNNHGENGDTDSNNHCENGDTDFNNDGENSDTDSNNYCENSDTDSNRDGENRDTEDVVKVTVETIEDINEKVIKKEMSIYKVDISKLNIPQKFEGTEEDLELEIDNQLMRNQKDKKTLKYHKLTENKCNSYCLCLFTYQSKTTDPVAHELTTQRGSKLTEFKKNRNTGNIIVFYRLIGVKKPEIFFLCSGGSYPTILKFVDINVRIEMIKSYLKDANIKSIEYSSLFGPAITTKFDFRTNMEDFFRQFDSFGKIITNVFGEIEPTSELSKCINTHTDKVKSTVIEFGTYKVKFARVLTCQKWTEVIELISERMAHKGKQIGQTQESIINAFESIQKVEDTTRLKDLNDTLNSRLIDAISTDKDTRDLFLGSKRPTDFTLASTFILKFKEKGTSRKVQEWGSSPTVDQVIKALHNDNNLELKTSQAVREAIEDKHIVITFKSQTVKSKLLPIQSLIHGSIVMDDVRYFKLSTFWYRISPSCIDRINRDFGRLAENAVLKNKKDTGFSLLDALKYTWSYKEQSFSIDDIQQVLGITETDAECVVNILSDKISPCKGETFLLTQNKNMYLLPSSNGARVGLVQNIAVALGDESKCREPTLKYIWDLSQNKKVRYNTKLIMGLEFEVVKANFQTQGNGRSKTMYQVKNPILSDHTERKLKDKLHADKITDLLSYLRSLLPLSEGEYNELYLHPQHKDVVIIPGDRVLVNCVELFDILIHDTKERVTYLVHIKDGFDVKVRDVCSQIRVSASLFWTDYMRGTQTNAEGFWKSGTSETVKTVYRIQLREKLKDLGKDKLISFFDNDIRIVYVFGFRYTRKDFLKERPIRSNSTIAKIELLTLFAEFAKYQVGGWRKFELELLQLKSDDGPLKKRKFDEKAPIQKKKSNSSK